MADVLDVPGPGRGVQLLLQRGPLDIEIISEEFIVMLRQLSYAIKNQLKAPKAPY